MSLTRSRTRALRADGAAVAWGPTNAPASFVPGGLTGVKAIAAGWNHNLVVRWGRLTPIVAEQPFDQFALPGGSVTLSAMGVGLAGVQYQWQIDGVNIDGATNGTLTSTNVQLADEGSYRVIISNEPGSIPSDVATFTIVRPPWILSASPSAAGVHWFTNELPLVGPSRSPFGLWARGKNFAIGAWSSRGTKHFQAVGDPLVAR
jgi:hypothetical protein